MIGPVVAIALAAAAANLPGAAPVPAIPFSETEPVSEAIAFMEGYASDLIVGNRSGVAERYDRRGAYFILRGAARLQSYAEIQAVYADARWRALPGFEWHDLVYVPAGPGSIVVAGRFSVQPEAAPAPIFYSYSNLLVRQDGRLRIRVEHETREPAPR